MNECKNTRLYSSLPLPKRFRTWAKIDPEALAWNYRTLRDRVSRKAPDCQAIAVIKADAYSHGAHRVIDTLIEEGCRFFAVSCLEEAIDARTMCRYILGRDDDCRILILGYTASSFATTLAEYDLVATAPSYEYLLSLSSEAMAAGVTVQVHIKLDTGMNRLGFPADKEERMQETCTRIEKASHLDGIRITGIFSHFADADTEIGEEPHGLTARQIERYLYIVDELTRRGVNVGLRHLCNSAGALRFPSLALDAVRLGIALYGVRPSEVFDLPLRPVMKLQTIISHIHTLKAGESVSYGATYTAIGDRLLATLPIGYGDGLLRAYSGAEVTVHAENGDFTAPIVGRICMDQCMIDITGHKAAVEDTVTLFGESPGSLYRLAARADTIPYESLCLVTARVPRIYP